MNQRQRWCIWLGLLVATGLYLMPPWRYDIAGEVQRTGSIALGRREAHAYSLRNQPPDYPRSWRQGDAFVVERSENAHIDALRLAIAWTFLVLLVLAAVRLSRTAYQPSSRQWAVLLTTGLAAWILTDAATIKARPRVEKYLLDRTFAERYAQYVDSLRAAAGSQPR